MAVKKFSVPSAAVLALRTPRIDIWIWLAGLSLFAAGSFLLIDRIKAPFVLVMIFWWMTYCMVGATEFADAAGQFQRRFNRERQLERELAQLALLPSTPELEMRKGKLRTDLARLRLKNP